MFSLRIRGRESGLDFSKEIYPNLELISRNSRRIKNSRRQPWSVPTLTPIWGLEQSEETADTRTLLRSYNKAHFTTGDRIELKVVLRVPLRMSDALLRHLGCLYCKFFNTIHNGDEMSMSLSIHSLSLGEEKEDSPSTNIKKTSEEEQQDRPSSSRVLGDRLSVPGNSALKP